MKNNENEQNAQQEKKLEEEQTSPSNWREAIYQSLRDAGIKVIDDTKEWEGKTAMFFPFRQPSQRNDNENNEEKKRE